MIDTSFFRSVSPLQSAACGVNGLPRGGHGPQRLRKDALHAWGRQHGRPAPSRDTRRRAPAAASSLLPAAPGAQLPAQGHLTGW